MRRTEPGKVNRGLVAELAMRHGPLQIQVAFWPVEARFRVI